MELRTFHSIDEIGKAEWDALIHDANYFHQHRSLKALENAKVEDSTLHYLCLFDEEELVGSAVLSLFSIDLSLFIGESGFVKALKKLSPGLFGITVLFCGTPISAGHKNLYFKAPEHVGEGMRLILSYIDQYCRDHKIKYSVFKEFTEKEMGPLEGALEGSGYFRGYSIPNVQLELPYNSYKDYMGALRSGYRRQVRKSLAKLDLKMPVLANGSGAEQGELFRVKMANSMDPGAFFPLYMQVMDRAKIKLEVLNEAFFRELFSLDEQDLECISLVRGKEVLGVFVIAACKDELLFLWTGKESERDDFDAYQNLMQAMIALAIERGKKRLVLGQTSYYPKMKAGGRTKELFIYFKCHKKLKNRVLRIFRKSLFPKLDVRQIEALKNAAP